MPIPTLIKPPPSDDSWWARFLDSLAPGFARPEEHEPDPRAFGAEPEEWQRVHDEALARATADMERLAAEKRLQDDAERSARSSSLGYGGRGLEGVVTDEPGGGWDQGAADAALEAAAPIAPPAVAGVPAPPGSEPIIQGPPSDLALIEGLSPTLIRDGRGGTTTWRGMPHEGILDNGETVQYGGIRATMAGPRPTPEESRAILAPHAFNAPPQAPPPGPPVPTTVTASRFDPSKEAFVPLAPPSGGAPVRESYSAAPYDPEGERLRAAEREMQDLKLEQARASVRDPLARERFLADQERQTLGIKAGIERMGESERRLAFMDSIQQIDDEAASAIARLRASGLADKEQRIEAVRERAEQLKESRKAAFGIGAKIGSSELYKTRPAY